jgi:hypothetical protein
MILKSVFNSAMYDRKRKLTCTTCFSEQGKQATIDAIYVNISHNFPCFLKLDIVFDIDTDTNMFISIGQ